MPPKPRTWLAVAVCIAVAAILTAADLGSKAWAVENLSRARFGTPPAVCAPDPSGYVSTVRVPTRPKVIVEHFFELRYAENCGAAFGIFNATNSIWKKVLFYSAALGAMVVLLRFFRQGRGGALFVVAVPTIISGAAGNLHDRFQLGYVVDFVRFYHRAWEYPTFNVADVAISIGVVALLIDGIIEERRERRAATAARAAEAERARLATDASGPDSTAEAAPAAAAEAPVSSPASTVDADDAPAFADGTSADPSET